MSFFKNVISHLLKQAEDGSTHSSFKVCDPTAVGSSPVRELSLDVVNLGDESNNSIITLAWKDSAEKVLEKTTSSEEASHLAQLISTDLAQLVKLTDENKYDEAKEVFKNMLKTYAQDTSTPTSTNLPPLHNTQAEKDMDEGLWKQARQIKLQNIFPSGTVQNLIFEDSTQLKEYQDSMKGTQSGKEVPLWEQEGKGKAPEESGELAPASLSYEEIEEQKADEHKNLEKSIDEKIKQELESALQQKAASVFGPADEELVKSLRAPGIGRNWDEIKKIFTKNLNRDEESTTIFLDEQRKKMGDDGVEMIKEEPEDVLRPPKELVPDSVHEKLLQDLEDKKHEPVEEVKEKEIEKVDEPIVEESAKKSVCPECNGEGDVPAVRGGHVIAISCPSCSGDKHIEHAPKELESDLNLIERADNADIRKVASSLSELVKQDVMEVTNSMYRMNAPGAKWYRFSVDGDKIYRGEYSWEDEFGPYQFIYNMETGEYKENPAYKPTAYASLKRAASYMSISETDSIVKTAADDVNPLQEPISEEPTMTTPEQDRVPFGQAQHRAPKPESWVVVQSDLKGELPAFRGKFVSEETESDGTKWGIVDRDGELLKVEMHRITPETEGAQTSDPVAEPQIEKPQETEIPVTPSLDSLHSASSLKEEASEIYCKDPDCKRKATVRLPEGNFCEKHAPAKKEEKESSQDDLLTIKAEAEQLLKDVEGMGKKAYQFIKKGLERHADDSAFEGNGWCRVWVQEDEIATDAAYAEALKLPDEGARIAALKEIGLKLAHEALRLADSAGSKVGVQSWFEALKPSDHDRIDWVALANPKSSEEEDLEFEREQMRKYGPEAVHPDFKDQIIPKSSLEPKVEKKADVMDTKCEECGEPLGPEVFLSKWPVCGKCTRKRHKKVTGSDFEKGISQNKTADEDEVSLIMAYESGELDEAGILRLFSMLIKNGHAWSLQGSYGRTAKALIEAGYINQNGTIIKDVVDTELAPEQKLISSKYAFKKQADEPAVEPKTFYKELKKAPTGVDREKATPASPELDQVLSKLDALQQNLVTLDTAKKQILAKAKEEVAKLEQSAERVQMEKELQESINKSGVLIDALENKVVAWRDQIYTLQSQEVSYVPNITPKEMLEKIYKRFSEAESFVSSVLSGMKSQAVNVLEKTLVKFPGKKSSLDKKSSIIDEWNDKLLQALKLLS